MRSSIIAAILAILIPISLMISPFPISYSSSPAALTNASGNEGVLFTTDSCPMV